MTVNVNGCVAFEPTPLAAVSVKENVPPLPAAGVPASVAVPFPLSVNVTPPGNVPDSLKLPVGKPVEVIVNVPAEPTVNVVLLRLVIAGAWFTVSVNDCVAFEPTPLAAVSVKENVPPLPAAGVPASVAVPFPLSVNVTPPGNVPTSEMLGVGAPVVITVKLPIEPAMNVVLSALTIVGAWGT